MLTEDQATSQKNEKTASNIQFRLYLDFGDNCGWCELRDENSSQCPLAKLSVDIISGLHKQNIYSYHLECGTPVVR